MSITLGSRIRSAIEAIGTTQSEAAKKTGIDRSRLNRIVNDHVAPTAEELDWLSTVLNTNVHELCDGIEVSEPVRDKVDLFAKLGQELVEERSRNSQLQAQVKRLEDELRDERERALNEGSRMRDQIAEQEARFRTQFGERAAAYQHELQELEQEIQALRQNDRALRGQCRGLTHELETLRNRLEQAERNVIAGTLLAGGLAYAFGRATGEAEY